ncbi:MAG: Calcium-gated potassium channel MthK [Candidatus Heimdallarchaeota archaeon LC_2]|nr:MAG: Calcium-gated potassium channel MthK [Candidatus Heimdallarchaeota archaeon LC_2]
MSSLILVKIGRTALLKKIIGDILGPIFAIITLVLVGSFVFSYYEDISYFESLYFVVVALSTVGLGDVSPETQAGKIVTIVMIVLGIGIISISISSIGNKIIKNTLNHDFRYEQAIKNYQKHVIVAGYGHIGRRIVEYLTGWRVNLVIIDADFDEVQAAREDGLAAIQGDIANPRELSKLNIKNAEGLVIAINDPNVTLFAGQAAKVANPKLWVIAEKNIHYDQAMYRSVHITKAIDRFSGSKARIRGIIWGLEIETFNFSMGDGTSFFRIPMLEGLTESDLDDLGFVILGVIKNNEFHKYSGSKQLDKASMLLVGGPSKSTKQFVRVLKSHLPPDDDGIISVLLIGYGDYAETILPSILSNSDEVVIIDTDESRRKLAKKAGGVKVEVRHRASKEQLKKADIILLTSRAAGHMLAIGVEAKTVNPNIKLYARATMAEHAQIFEKAGADYVFSPEVDCAVELSSTVISNIFNTQAIPFANGQLLFHSGNTKIKKVSKRQVLASYNSKKNETKFFGKYGGKESQTLEFVEFKKEIDFLSLDRIIYSDIN